MTDPPAARNMVFDATDADAEPVLLDWQFFGAGDRITRTSHYGSFTMIGTVHNEHMSTWQFFGAGVWGGGARRRPPPSASDGARPPGAGEASPRGGGRPRGRLGGGGPGVLPAHDAAPRRSGPPWGG